MVRHRSIVVVGTLCLLAAGCSKGVEEVGEGSSPGSAPARQSRPAPAPAGGLHYRAPQGWVEEAPASPMRKAQFRLPRVEGDSEDAQLVVFHFPGQGGSVEANVNRWVGQFAPGNDAEELKPHLSREKVNGLAVTVLDVRGTYRGGGPMMGSARPKAHFRLLGAVAETDEGPWFFKLTGPERTVDHWEKSFETFVASLSPGP